MDGEEGALGMAKKYGCALHVVLYLKLLTLCDGLIIIGNVDTYTHNLPKDRFTPNQMHTHLVSSRGIAHPIEMRGLP